MLISGVVVYVDCYAAEGGDFLGEGGEGVVVLTEFIVLLVIV